MRFRTLLAVLLAPVVLAACDDNASTGIAGIAGTATVQFINASTTPLDVATNGTVGAGNGPIVYGTAGSCMTVDAASPGLVVRNAGTTTTIAGFTPAFTAGGSYTVVVYGASGGVLQFVTLSNAFTPAAGQAGLRAVNVGPAGSSYDVYVGAPGAALGTPSATNVVVGTGSSYFGVSATSAQHIAVTNAGTQTVVLDFGSSNTFAAGRRSTLVITPLGTDATLPRGFIISGC